MADTLFRSVSGRAERTWQDDETHSLIDRLVNFREQMASVERSFASAIDDVHPNRRVSAKNLLHYVALRQHDIRPFQEQLVQRGLSYIVEAVRALDDIRRRMQDHQVKKRPMLRRLKLADNLFSRETGGR